MPTLPRNSGNVTPSVTSASFMKFDPDPTTDEFAAMVERAMAEIPSPFHDHLDGSVVIEDRADAETLARLSIASPLGLLGLYQGIPLPRRSTWQTARLPDVIRLFREPILYHARAKGVDVYEMIRHVLVHEIAHHFGFSDADIFAVERGPDR